MKFRDKLIRFMYGRYGVDDLYKFFFMLYFILIIFNLFFRSEILTLIELGIFVIMTYRVFSRDIYKRSKENQTYLKLKNNFFKIFKNIKRNYNDRKEYVYKKCSKCKTTLRLPLPSKRGFHHVRCPECKKRLTVFSLRQEKIEIIKTKRKEVRDV